MKKLLLLISFCLCAFTHHARADDNATGHYVLDKTHTQILFFVDHLGFSKSQGKFLDFDGFFNFNQIHPEKSDVEIIIQSNSIDMDDAAWNKHMKSKDFFNVEAFQTIMFKSTSITVTGDKTARMAGDLTLLGITKPVMLDVLYNKSGKHAFSGKYVSGFSATTKLKRSDFGMTYGLPLIGDNVEFRIEVEGLRTEK